MLHRALQRVREWWSVEDPEERIEGSGEVVEIDPACNGRREAEREMQRISEAAEQELNDQK
jgi:hypothetical protein